MKIAFAIPALVGGGSENQMRLLANGLAQMGFEILVLYTIQPEAVPYFEPNICLVHITTNSNYSLVLLNRLSKVIKKEQPQIIMSWITQTDIIVGMLKMTTNNFKWIIREGSDKSKRKKSWKLRLRKILACNADLIIANSNNGIKYWESKSKRKKTKVILNGFNFNMNYFSPVKRGNKIVYVGRLIKSKNVDMLINAFNALKSKTFKLIIIGDGPERQNLKDLRNNLRLEHNIEFKGYLPNSEVLDNLKASKVFCSLSLHEGMPNVVIEALYSGVNLVLSSIPSHHEIVPEAYAFFVNPLDVEQVTDGLKNAINAPFQLVDKQIEALKYNSDKMVNSYIKVFNQLKLERSS